MTKGYIAAFVIISIGIVLISMFLPWWISALWITVIVAVLQLPLRAGIIISAVSFSIIWLLSSLYFQSKDATDLIGRTAELLGGISAFLMIVITAIIGLITGALSGWLGSTIGYVLKRS